MPAVIPSKTKRTSRRLTVAEREKAAKYKIETGVTYAQLSKWLEEQIGIKVPASTLSGHLKDYKDGKFQQKDGQAMFIDGSCHNIKDGEYTLLETFLYKWIRKSDGSLPLTGDIVRQKALEYIGIFYPHKKDKFMAIGSTTFFRDTESKVSGLLEKENLRIEKRHSLQYQSSMRPSKIMNLAKFITWMRLA